MGFSLSPVPPRAALLLMPLLLLWAPLPASARISPHPVPVGKGKSVRTCTWHGSLAQLHATWVLTSFRHATHWNRMEWDGRLNLRDLLRDAPSLDQNARPRRLSASYSPPLLDSILQEANLYWELTEDEAFQILTPPGGLVFCSDCRQRDCRMHARWFDPAGKGDRMGFAVGRMAGAPQGAREDGATSVPAPPATPALSPLAPLPPLRASLPAGYVDADRARARENQSAQTPAARETAPAILDGAIPL